ncbi:hypothetical protein LCGC14_1348200, partial [marine sediment metagenome]
DVFDELGFVSFLKPDKLKAWESAFNLS